MNMSEASRQYQIALEYRQYTQRMLGDTISAQDEIMQARVEEARAWTEVWRLWRRLPAQQIGVS